MIQKRNEQNRRTRNTDRPELLTVVEITTVGCYLFTVTIKKLHGVIRKNVAIPTHQLPALAVRNGAYNDLVLRHTGTIHYLRYNVGYTL